MALLIGGAVMLLALSLMLPSNSQLLVLLAGFCLAVCLVMATALIVNLVVKWLNSLSRSDESKVIVIPDRQVAVIYLKGRRGSVYEGSTFRYFPTRGEEFKLFDVRPRQMVITHAVETRDRAYVDITGNVTWQIRSVSKYLDNTINDDKQIIETTIKSILVKQFGQRAYRELVDGIDDIARNTVREAFNDLWPYGLRVSTMQITNMGLMTKTKAQQEAERLRTLDLAVSEINGRTLEHVERIEGQVDPGIKVKMEGGT
jgi:regulator of protease activity HflC (stomatin/prohibitin superfamily)